MHLIRIGVLVATTAIAFTASAAAQTAPPAVRTRTVPIYPVQALSDGVSGDVKVRATIDATGRVEHVEIIDVPRVGMGFEESVTAALYKWQFTPATLRGVPTSGTLELTIPFKIWLQGDYLFRVSPADAWLQVKSLLSTLKYKTRRMDDDAQLAITRAARYNSKIMPDPQALGLARGSSLGDVVWYVSVSPYFTNARVSIAAELDARRVDGMVRIYRNEPLAEWFRDRLAEQLELQPEPLSDLADQRARQSPPVLAGRPGGSCPLPSAAPQQPLDLRQAAGVVMPKKLVDITPFFPATELRNRHEGRVTLSGTVTEHGSLTRIRLEEPKDVSPDFWRNSVAAASMWRFSPALLGGCPTPTQVTIEMHYSIR